MTLKPKRPSQDMLTVQEHIDRGHLVGIDQMCNAFDLNEFPVDETSFMAAQCPIPTCEGSIRIVESLNPDVAFSIGPCDQCVDLMNWIREGTPI